MNDESRDQLFAGVIDDVAAYYRSRLAEHGTTAKGVDWNSTESQVQRFAQFEKLLPAERAFSVNDIGCGYGAFLDVLALRHSEIDYCGTDISAEMIEAARNRFSHRASTSFVKGSRPNRAADYGFASGIFNVRLGHDAQEWEGYFISTLDMICETSKKGFAFNCLTSYSDAEYMKDHLYYANPCEVFDLCKRRYSRQVALLHDYGLYEFTILVRKEV